MPSALSHALLAQDCMAATATGLDTRLILAGAQGTDPFFFFGNIPWRKRKGVEEAFAFAECFHGIEATPLFDLLERHADSQDEPARSAMLSFTAGLVLHYLLDRAMHPYVFYTTGFDAQGKVTDGFADAHNRLESAISTSLFLKLRSAHGRSPRLLPPPRLWAPAAIPGLDHADALLCVLPDSLWQGRKFQCSRLAPGTYTAAWADLATGLGLLYDPFGIEAAILDGMQGIFDSRDKRKNPASRPEAGTRKGSVAALVRALIKTMRPMIDPPPSSLHDPGDILNETHRPWLDPATGEVHRTGILDLYREALQEGIVALAHYEKLRQRAESGTPKDSIPGGTEFRFDPNPQKPQSTGHRNSGDPALAWRRLLDGRNHEGRLPGYPMRFQAADASPALQGGGSVA